MKDALQLCADELGFLCLCAISSEKKYIIISLLLHQQGLEVEEDHNLTNST